MRVVRLFPALLLLVAAISFAQTSSTKPAPGFSIDSIDKSVDPCVDFYQYACGNWLKQAVIPADQAQWVSFVELNERNQGTMHDILEKAAVNSPTRTPVEQKIGDLYGSCMD